MPDNYKQKWCGCELKEDTDDPECIDSSEECEECEVYKKYWDDFEKEKAKSEAEWNKKPSITSIINGELGSTAKSQQIRRNE